MKVLSLFSSIGGLDKGLEDAGMTVVAQVERDPLGRVLAIHDQREHDEQLLRHGPAIRAALKREADALEDAIHIDNAQAARNHLREAGEPWEPWMNGCDPGNPCGTRWDNDADRAVWHQCGSHPGGKHHHTPPYDDPPTDVISIAEWQARVAQQETTP